MSKAEHKYIKAVEPQWSRTEQVKHIMRLMRALRMQVDSMTPEFNGLHKKRLSDIGQYLQNQEHWLFNTFAPANGQVAEEFTDNDGSLAWEVLNELRKANDRQLFLAMCYGFNAGAILDQQTGQPLNELEDQGVRGRLVGETEQAA